MTYTNGLNLDTLLPIITARKGWEQPSVATFTPVLSTAVKTCNSGMYYNFDHSSCSPVNIWNCQEDDRITDANMNAFLLSLKKQVAIESMVAVFRENAPVEPPKILFEKQFRTQYKPIDNSGKFCGWMIQVAQGDYATIVESVMLTFTAAATVTLYCYNDLKADPIWSKEYTVTEGYNQQVFVVDDLVLTRLNDTHKGGIFYLGYYQQEIENQSVKAADVYLNWWAQFNMVGYQGFEAASDFDALTFVRSTYFSNYRTYGLNLELSTTRDQTNTVIRNANSFDKLQGLLMAVKCIELQMNSQRANGGQRISRENYEMLYNEIEGLKGGEGIPYRQGLKDRINREVKRLQHTFFPPSEVTYSIPPVNGTNEFTPFWGYQI